MADGYRQDSAGQATAPPDPPAVKAEQDKVQEVIDAFSFAKSYETEQREAERAELEFTDVNMWLQEHLDSRKEHVDEATGRKTPARPALSINLADQNIQQIVSEARQAKLALTVKPKAGIANTKTAGYYKGLIRNIQVESGALEVRLWALERASKIGRGFYLITAEFANDGDFDLDLVLKRILDQSTVYWDPYAQHAAYEDAEECVITDWISLDARTRRWKEKPVVVPEGAFDDEDNDWFAADADDPSKKRVRIATYYKVQHTEKLRGFHPQTGSMWLDEMPPALVEAVKAKAPGTGLRSVDQRSVIIRIVDGTQVLEETPWLGRYIPVITVVGKEQFTKGKRRYRGHIAHVQDILRAMNVLISSATEIAGTMPRTPYLMYAGQDAGFEDMWDDAPTKNYTRLYIDPDAKSASGETLPLPQRQQTEPQIQGLILLLNMMQQMYHAVSGSVAPQLRAVNPLDRSGKAIEALQRQGAAGTSNYLDNLATISMPYEGKVFISAIPKYYDTPGRILMVVGEEHDDEIAIMIKRPFIRNGDGQPEGVPCPICRGRGEIAPPLWNPFIGPKPCPACEGTTFATQETMPETWQDQPVEYVDFSDGEFKVIASLDRSYQTKQEEALAGMTALAETAPQLVPLYAHMWVRAMGFSGSGEIADIIKAKVSAGEDDDETLKNLDPAVRAKFSALKQQHQETIQALQQAQQIIQTKAVEKASDKEVAAIRAAVQERVEDLKIQGRMLEKGADTQATGALEILRGQLKEMQQESQHRHEILLQLLKEKGEKEVERHSVALHDAAAANAAARMGASESVAYQRDRASAAEDDARGRATAAEDHGRERSAAAEDADRSEGAQARADRRAEDAAARAAERDAALRPPESGQ